MQLGAKAPEAVAAGPNQIDERGIAGAVIFDEIPGPRLEPILRPTPRRLGRGNAGCLANQMNNATGRMVPTRPAGSRRLETEINFFVIHEVVVIQQSDIREYFATHQQASTRDPIDLGIVPGNFRCHDKAI